MLEKRPPGACKDCWAWWSPITTPGDFEAATRRAAPHPGPRCVTHHRTFKREQKLKSAQRRDKSVYGLQPGGYEALKELQGGGDPICLHAKGKTRRLCVDHDHKTGRVRGLLCKTCNSMLGLARDDPEFFRRIIAYLEHPPATDLDPIFLENPYD